MAEVAVGKHCSLASCQQLDFLPLECDGCGEIFCKLHSSRDSHACTKVRLKEASGVYAGTHGYDCALPDCRQRELVPVLCDVCGKNLCLAHRLPGDHSCLEKRSRAQPYMPVTAALVQKMQEKCCTAESSKTCHGTKNRRLSDKVRLMKLKQQATGDSRVLLSQRCYFCVLPPGGDTGVPLHFSQEWTIARLVDEAASRCHVRNQGKTSTGMVLRVRAENQDQLLPPEVRISELLHRDSLQHGTDLRLVYTQVS